MPEGQKSGSKIKRKLVGGEHPPTEIVSNTKARREWLATRAAEINAMPNREAKIVGTGSYQSISIYELTTVEGRLRHRGYCQVCGHAQVVDEVTGKLVLHGYTRPGDGYVIGRCPGADQRSLNVDKTITTACFEHAVTWLAEAKRDYEAAQAATAAARRALWNGEARLEDDAYRTKPKPPRKPAKWEGRVAFARYDDKMKAYQEAFTTWAAQFPLSAAIEQAERHEAKERDAEWHARQNHQHFDFLLNKSGYHGALLIEEIVP